MSEEQVGSDVGDGSGQPPGVEEVPGTVIDTEGTVITYPALPEGPILGFARVVVRGSASFAALVRAI